MHRSDFEFFSDHTLDIIHNVLYYTSSQCKAGMSDYLTAIAEQSPI